ncbi:hypothetical protein HAZT_HAZT002548 [Hyalella azteca]|uniref:Uncharacterized protein n=1 Tax=Hyalella azteca TaxID=294128 RepID=A0A6A0H2K0_HYAAZ|nr:hypothetical protein HAZT_HAZT002548 [Hyalella azteca]
MGHGTWDMGQWDMGQWDMGHGTMGHGTWDMGHGTMGHGTWDMGQWDMGQWDMGQWDMGQWDMGHGTMGHGTWDMGHGMFMFMVQVMTYDAKLQIPSSPVSTTLDVAVARTRGAGGTSPRKSPSGPLEGEENANVQQNEASDYLNGRRKRARSNSGDEELDEVDFSSNIECQPKAYKRSNGPDAPIFRHLSTLLFLPLQWIAEFRYLPQSP